MRADLSKRDDWRRWSPVVPGYPSKTSSPIDIAGANVAIPSLAALHLETARRAYGAALDIRQLLVDGRSLESPDSLLYEYLQQLLVVVASSVATLEAFANAVIQQGWELGHIWFGRQPSFYEDKHISLRAKLEEALPAILNSSTPESYDPTLWDEVTAMITLRNKFVIHSNTELREDAKFWKEKFDLPPNYPEISARLVSYFVEDMDCWLNRKVDDEFDVIRWLNAYLSMPEGQSLTQANLHNALHFAMMWGAYESKLRSGQSREEQRESAASWTRRAVDLAEERGVLELSDYEPYLMYFRTRYIKKDGKPNGRFGGLGLRDRDRAEDVKTGLLGGDAATGVQVFALLMIIFRLRSNLFHGLKQIRDLPNQDASYAVANAALATFLTAYG